MKKSKQNFHIIKKFILKKQKKKKTKNLWYNKLYKQ